MQARKKSRGVLVPKGIHERPIQGFGSMLVIGLGKAVPLLRVGLGVLDPRLVDPRRCVVPRFARPVRGLCAA